MLIDQQDQLNQLRLVNQTENYAKHTFQALAVALTVDLQWTYHCKTINVSID